MSVFPLRRRPAVSYHERPRAFGSPRDDGARSHAGCDLYAKAGTEVLAVEDGVVVRGPYPFYDGVGALEVRHPSGVVRYGEIHAAPGIHAGVRVGAGQTIGTVAALIHAPIDPITKQLAAMLHFEMYGGAGSGQLTDRSIRPFERRTDLVDPTGYLDSCLAAVG